MNLTLESVEVCSTWKVVDTAKCEIDATKKCLGYRHWRVLKLLTLKSVEVCGRLTLHYKVKECDPGGEFANGRGIGVRARPNLGGRHLFARKKFSLPEFWAFFAQKISRLGGAETLFARTFCLKIVYLLHKFWQFCPKNFFLGGLPPPPPPWLVRLWAEEQVSPTLTKVRSIAGCGHQGLCHNDSLIGGSPAQ